jgi:hypothetical protein
MHMRKPSEEDYKKLDLLHDVMQKKLIILSESRTRVLMRVSYLFGFTGAAIVFVATHPPQRSSSSYMVGLVCLAGALLCLLAASWPRKFAKPCENLTPSHDENLTLALDKELNKTLWDLKKGIIGNLQETYTKNDKIHHSIQRRFKVSLILLAAGVEIVLIGMPK